MGRTRKQLSEQRGHLTKAQQTKRYTEQELVRTDNSYFLVPPKWLTDETAVCEYKRLVSAMSKMDMLGDLDANNLAGYCNAFANYLKATRQLDDLILSGEKGDYENPLIGIQIKYAKEMRDFARLCGLSIDSRLKFAAVRLDEISDTIDSEFGGI
jgi:P27 family predicted phage terminase small subunit